MHLHKQSTVVIRGTGNVSLGIIWTAVKGNIVVLVDLALWEHVKSKEKWYQNRSVWDTTLQGEVRSDL